MSIFEQANEARLGALNVAPIISMPQLPNILSEWAAIVPLVCHLATHRDDHATTGKVALAGRVSVSLFPRLGSLSGLSRLIGNTRKFLDHASSRGGTSLHVWDVYWGGMFPCSNGIAVEFIIDYCQQRHGRVSTIRMPDILPELRPVPPRLSSYSSTNLSSRSSISSHGTRISSSKNGTRAPRPDPDKDSIFRFRRSQTLHVFRCFRKPGRPLKSQPSNSWSFAPHILRPLCAAVVAVALLLCGSFGTAAMLFCTAISGFAASLLVAVKRPPGYLENNEAGLPSGCMLAAAHQNATEWYLFVGDRGIVDTLLNKTMFWIPDTRTARLVGGWLRLAHFIQLAAMTFAAGQKGWDGVCLVALLAVNWLLERCANSNANLAHSWLTRECVGVEIKKFEFSGRSYMLGAIQLYSGSQTTSWMDDIITPHPRREAWLRRLFGQEPDHSSWSPADLAKIDSSARLSVEAAFVMNAELGAPTGEA
ncbi:hypothetical protein B0T26DRAFT_829590 [Lasiosphaeria miniovina]|uniref:Uncharacterized protein n=1 Tax=Lasiosphaeria miniovina TaxID=1954250 RepID=A0AA40AKS3_9PEZI|nr:uncharacterized protein B0T26DRAFT_829590 [Lasiosphaeria miniovina]KAK0717654.1 hypothetical protein B0T26DRAFT_829590 [Lasiosphaeria miniovina]